LQAEIDSLKADNATLKQAETELVEKADQLEESLATVEVQLKIQEGSFRVELK